MAYTNTGINIDSETLETFDAILEAMGEQSPYGATPTRSAVVEELMEEFNAEHRHLLDGDTDGGGETADPAADPEADTGNSHGLIALATGH